MPINNVEILTKTKPLPQYKEKQKSHEKIMKRNQEEDKWILDISFYGKVTKRIKDKLGQRQSQTPISSAFWLVN